MLSKLLPTAHSTKTAGATGRDSVTLSGDDNETAARTLASYLKRHGIRILRQNGQNVSVQRGSSKIILSPKLTDDGIDRIVVSKFYRVKDDHRHGAEVEAMAMKLNADLNIGTFSVDGDGDLLYQSHITFMDRVEFAEIDAFLEFMDHSMMMAAVTHSEILQYLT